ncbi:MAG: YbhN family protein [Candidatus Coproplasma sp.]
MDKESNDNKLNSRISESTANDSVPPKEEQASPPLQKGRAKIIWNIILVALIVLGIASMFGIVDEVGEQSNKTFKEAFCNASPLFMALLVAIILCVMVLDCSKFAIINKTVTGKFKLKVAIKTSFLGKYYDAVTPFSTGGQPMQIYYLNTSGISGGSSTAIVMIRYFSSIFTWIATGATLMVYGAVKGVTAGVAGATILNITGWLGVGVNAVIPLFLTSFLIFPKSMYYITALIVKIGKKLKIVKDEEGTTAKALKVVDDFKRSFKVMATTPINLILLMAVSLGEALLTFSVPYFVMKAFSCQVSGMFLTIASLNAFATFGVSFIPTPGNSGVVESLGALAFSISAGSVLAWSVLFWRFSVYYIYILIGLTISSIDFLRKLLKKKRVKKLSSKTAVGDNESSIGSG